MEAGAVLFEKSRDEAAFRHAAVEIKALRERAAAGEIVLAYADEVGFVQAHPLRSAWTPRGSAHRHLIQAKRGKRLNVLGALLSTGEIFCTRLWQTWTADLFVGWLGLLKQHVGCALTIIIDNAPIHTAKKIRPFIDLLKSQGVTLYFLPPYSPELNRIERLWHKIKHTWMELKCRTAETLEADVAHILDNFGGKYKFSF